MKRFVISAVLVLLATGMVFAGGQAEEGEKAYPQKTVEFVVPASAGGGSDTLARILVDIIQKNNLVDGTIVVLNKPGGASAVGQAYVTRAQVDGDHTIFTMNAAHALAGRANPAIESETFVPLAVIAMDNVLFLTKADSPYKSLEDVIAAAKKNPDTLTVGCADNLDQLCVAQINNEAGVKMTSVYFDGASEITAALLGNHIDFAIANPNECIGQVRAGGVRPLATFATERLDDPFKDVQTFAELGYPNIEFQMFRSVVGGAGMSPEVQQYWSDVFEKVVATDQWKTEYIEKKVLDPKFMPASEYAPYHKRVAERLYKDAQDIGLLK